MAAYTIQDFWQQRLPVRRVAGAPLVKGWSFEEEGIAAFTEAPLTLSADLGPADPQHSPILLVSAPGAVGKSTLARQVAHVTGAVYVDLATADPVGGNTISGGLLRSGLYPSWEQQTTALLVDGLDEARLRVTQEGFEAFLKDVAELSKDRRVPIVLFGRTGAIQDAWLVFGYSGAETATLEIGYYGPEAAADFAQARLQTAHPERAHGTMERKVIQLLLERLRKETEHDGDRFAGYAPVLQAVAERVAQETNVAALAAQLERGEQPVTLQTVAMAILERERGKLKTLPFEDATVVAKLYLPDEQLDRLVARVYGLPPPEPPAMGAKDAQTYSAALTTWVAEHPFLDGARGTSSAVFDAVIGIRALRAPASAGAALQRELSRGASANPFLSEFYLPDDGASERVHLSPEHIGVVYASLRARLAIGDTASLLVEGPEDALDEEALRAEVEITLVRRGVERARVLHFDTEQTGVLRLGAYVQDVELTVPHTRVELGPGPEVVLIAPVSIQADQLALRGERVVVECPAGMTNATVSLEANCFDGAQMASVPILRGNVSLSASWPGARAHPWTSFATEPTPVTDPRIDEALRRFRKFVTAFRSHSKGALARFQDKIEHARMTKGTGKAVLDQMVEEKILSLSGNMYFLDPARLGAQTGATYADCAARRFGAKTIEFIKRALPPQPAPSPRPEPKSAGG